MSKRISKNVMKKQVYVVNKQTSVSESEINRQMYLK